MDQVSLVPSLTRLSTFWALQPEKIFEQTTTYYQQSLRASMAAAARSVGAAVDGPAQPGRDKRFADPAWTDNPYFWWVRQQYLLRNEAAAALVDDSDLDEADRRKSAFATQTLLDALSPTNFAATNPAVLKRAIETNGQSLARGMQTYLDDLANNGGAPQQVATGVH